jgi:hypothetical protein
MILALRMSRCVRVGRGQLIHTSTEIAQIKREIGEGEKKPSWELRSLISVAN